MIPKFRAWDKARNEMNYKVMVGNCDLSDGNWTCPIIWIEERKNWLHFDDDYECIMQSTGLKDKNGKEIFEGDIVKMAKDVYSEPTYYEVVRHRGGAYRLESKQHGCELWLRHTGCEVVGNVYENKELLDA
ncbi:MULTISPECIES: YopX family protein [unclassified Streptococcus]|uniref:YopX family protein n=1 Tax=unclassified Streptococcus TaxID=2608887 RepID=UPI0020C875A3|nr:MULTISPECIES: YopX family protein [unclassified Streptococcus]MCP9060403.1 YopX family protein [Streptococcus sp. CF7_Ac1-12]MCP9084984.1 YopX family protein [Streptococcus sp. CF7_Ac1-8]